MKKIWSSLILVLSIFTFAIQARDVSVSSADMLSQEAEGRLTNVGFAPFNLTAPTFNCDGFIAATSPLKEIHISFLYNTFGNDFSCLNRLLKNPKVKSLQVHLINEPGHRNRRLGKYEFLYGVGNVNAWNKKMASRDPALKTKLTRYVIPLQKNLSENLRDDIEFYVSPGLESNLGDRAGRVLVSWTRELFPNARIVWNAYRGTRNTIKPTQADLMEGHGFSPALRAPCIYNMDGLDVAYPSRPALGQVGHQEGGTKNWLQSGRPLFQQMEKYGNRCELAFVWTQEANGLSYKQDGRFVDPRRRNHNIPTSVYQMIMRDVIQVQRSALVYPEKFVYSSDESRIESTCSVLTDKFEDREKSGNLLKQSEFRERGGVLILGREYSSVSSVKLVHKSSVVDTYQKTGAYKDGRTLFRSKVSPVTYPLNTYLVFNFRGQRNCYKIPNPRIRLD
jgi:hypothetical protein